MDASIVLSVVVAIITLIAVGLYFYRLRPKKDENLTQEQPQEQEPHKYLTPPALSDNPKWAELLEDWQSLTQLGSWTPEYSRAEEGYRLKMREFLQTDLDKSNILDVPIVALVLQYTEIYIERYHTRAGDLDYKKSLQDDLHIIHVMYNDKFPENLLSTIREIHGVRKFVDDEGVDAAMDHFRKIKSELLNETSHEHS